jgi:tripeptide aminopeptidase
MNRDKMIERFLRYVAIDSMADDTATGCPSTKKQWDMARLLEKELNELGMQQVKTDEFGFVTAVLSANTDKKGPVVGFMAHYDTIPGFSGTDIKPRIIENYNGGDIYLGDASGLTTEVSRFPALKKYKGCDLIVTDGTTVLGADDKAGIAEIMAACEYFIENPEIPHCEIRVAFTPDEEIGTGIGHFDVAGWGCDFAYTIDGGEEGGLAYETFNAAKVAIKVTGVSVHPGWAKNTMINAVKIFGLILSMLPEAECPEHTEGYEGFYHLSQVQGSVELVTANMILRDHDRDKLEHKKAVVLAIADFINTKYGQKLVEMTITDQYQNMYEVLKDKQEIVDAAKTVMQKLGMTPVVEPVRGGTDGAQITFKGCPTPNLFTGGLNAHGPHELAVIQSMEKAAWVIIELGKHFAQ